MLSTRCLDRRSCSPTPAPNAATPRITTRTIQVLPAPKNLPFPHVNQVSLIERYTTDPAGTPLSALTALGVASPTPQQAGPSDLAGYVREQCSIEVIRKL